MATFLSQYRYEITRISQIFKRLMLVAIARIVFLRLPTSQNCAGVKAEKAAILTEIAKVKNLLLCRDRIGKPHFLYFVMSNCLL